MITEFLLDLIEGAVSWLVGLLPDFTLPSWLTDGSIGSTLSDLGSKVAPVSSWFPTAVLVSVIGVVLIVRAVMFGVAVVVKIYAMVRGGAS